MTAPSLDKLQQLLQQEKQLANTIMNHISEGVIQLNAQFEVDDINATAEALCECQKSFVLGKPIDEVFSIFDENSQQSIPFSAENAKNHQKPTHCLLVNKYQHQRLIESFYCLLKDESDEVFAYLFIFRDITAQSADSDRVQWQASHDNLTGLVNRKEMEERLEKSLQNMQTHNILSVLLVVDIDEFEWVNQTFGYAVGDEYLQRISLQMLKQLRARDTLARIGDNEFGILLENCLIDDAAMIANKIKTAIKDYRFVWGGKEFNLTASVGLLSLNNETETAENIIRDAESASQSAKSEGGNALHIHVKNDEQLAEQRRQLSIIAEIDNAFENNRFRLFFQPIYSVDKKSVAHWEVLIRLLDHENTILSPNDFLPAAEKYGLITQIDRWVFNRTVKFLADLPDSIDKPQLAINLSPNSLEDNQCKVMILETLKERTCLQGKIIFEITETLALSNIESINVYLHQLKELGCRLALDDFGTGVSTYSYLKRLDIDMIKIDGEFIENIHDNVVNQEIVSSLTKIAHLMNITTTAEWVCDEQVYEYLNQLDMDYYQGYHIGKPLSEEELIDYLGNGDKPVL